MTTKTMVRVPYGPECVWVDPAMVKAIYYGHGDNHVVIDLGDCDVSVDGTPDSVALILYPKQSANS